MIKIMPKNKFIKLIKFTVALMGIILFFATEFSVKAQEPEVSLQLEGCNMEIKFHIANINCIDAKANNIKALRNYIHKYAVEKLNFLLKTYAPRHNITASIEDVIFDDWTLGGFTRYLKSFIENKTYLSNSFQILMRCYEPKINHPFENYLDLYFQTDPQIIKCNNDMNDMLRWKSEIGEEADHIECKHFHNLLCILKKKARQNIAKEMSQSIDQIVLSDLAE